MNKNLATSSLTLLLWLMVQSWNITQGRSQFCQPIIAADHTQLTNDNVNQPSILIFDGYNPTNYVPTQIILTRVIDENFRNFLEWKA